MSDFSCQVDIPKQPGLSDNELTVGREFYLHCKANTLSAWPKDFKIEKAQFVWAEENQRFTLKLLALQPRSDSEIDILVTPYIAGQVQIPDLRLYDGEKNLSLGPVNFDVVSVLDPKQPKKEPYGPMGPVSILWPLAYTLIILFFISILVALGGFTFWRRKKKKEIERKIKELETALPAADQFFKDLRQLKRENNLQSAEDILFGRDRVEQSLRVFLSRHYRLLATTMKSTQIVAQLHKQFMKRAETLHLEKDLAALLREMEKSQVDQNKLQASDVRQLISQSQIIVEQLLALEERTKV